MCLNKRDDTLIGSRNIEEHNTTLEKVFQQAQDYSLTFNLAKFQFWVEELKFYGYRFTKMD